MMTRCTVLMYHATPFPGSASQVGADPHYSVPTDAFKRHLDIISHSGQVVCALDQVPALAKQGLRPICFTFDDGHATNLHAASMLAERGWSGTFFINPSTVGTPGFLTWDELTQMSQMGMSIQSHAQHHRYLGDGSEQQQRQELSDSKACIELRLRTTVTQIAPPGGRINSRTWPIAKQLGYTQMATSRVGLWNLKNYSAGDIPRFAMLASTSIEQFQSWISQDKSEVFKQILRYETLALLKKAIGNRRYDRFREYLLGSQKDY